MSLIVLAVRRVCTHTTTKTISYDTNQRRNKERSIKKPSREEEKKVETQSDEEVKGGLTVSSAHASVVIRDGIQVIEERGEALWANDIARQVKTLQRKVNQRPDLVAEIATYEVMECRMMATMNGERDDEKRHMREDGTIKDNKNIQMHIKMEEIKHCPHRK